MRARFYGARQALGRMRARMCIGWSRDWRMEKVDRGGGRGANIR